MSVKSSQDRKHANTTLGELETARREADLSHPPDKGVLSEIDEQLTRLRRYRCGGGTRVIRKRIGSE